MTKQASLDEGDQVGRKPKPAEVRARFFTARSSGATLKEAAAAAGVSRTTGHDWLAQCGGVRPRRRKPRPALRLSLDEREVISRGLAQRHTMTAITGELGRSVRPRVGKLAGDPVLRGYVGDVMRLSHETIYTSLFVQAKAVFPSQLTAQHRTRLVRRRPQRRVKGPQGPGRIPQMTKIADRPARVLDRSEPGHWEGDLLVGRYSSRRLATFVERQRFLAVNNGGPLGGDR